MFRHDRRELETLAARLDAERARVARSRVRLARAGRRVFDNKLALLAPLTAGALTGAAALHREPRRGGRFSARELFAATTALTGLVELFRDAVLPALTGRASDATDREPEAKRAPASWRPPAPGAVKVPAPSSGRAGTTRDAASTSRSSSAPPEPVEPPWPQRLPRG